MEGEARFRSGDRNLRKKRGDDRVVLPFPSVQ